MKLRNKRTGEIGNFCYGHTNELCVSWQKDDGFWDKQEYKSLAELTEEWKDYEEPKKWWYIDIAGEVKQGEGNVPEYLIDGMKQIGNYFETKEEAEKTVEKLEAWKRLKDKGFSFTGITKTSLDMDCIQFEIGNDFYKEQSTINSELNKDLDLLFSQEDD